MCLPVQTDPEWKRGFYGEGVKARVYFCGFVFYNLSSLCHCDCLIPDVASDSGRNSQLDAEAATAFGTILAAFTSLTSLSIT
jgi:hypothetical protein